jgi:hypothetical protein
MMTPASILLTTSTKRYTFLVIDTTLLLASTKRWSQVKQRSLKYWKEDTENSAILTNDTEEWRYDEATGYDTTLIELTVSLRWQIMALGFSGRHDRLLIPTSQ